MSVDLVGMRFHRGRHLWHVRGIVDDRLICRRWWRRRQEWHYEGLDAMEIDLIADYNDEHDIPAPVMEWATQQLRATRGASTAGTEKI